MDFGVTVARYRITLPDQKIKMAFKAEHVCKGPHARTLREALEPLLTKSALSVWITTTPYLSSEHSLRERPSATVDRDEGRVVVSTPSEKHQSPHQFDLGLA